MQNEDIEENIVPLKLRVLYGTPGKEKFDFLKNGSNDFD